MQLTKFDRWLREKFVYQTHIHTLRPPEMLPAGVRAVELPEVPGKRYKHLFVADSSRAADAFIAHLKENSQMFTTQIVDSDAWFVPFIAPKNKSLTWWLVSVAFFTVSGISILLYAKGFIQDPEFRKNFMDAVKLLKS